MEKGFIKLSRSFFSNKIWQAARTFSVCEAWLDLIQSARFDATPPSVKTRIGGCEVEYGRGQYPASIRFLSKKWGRSERWVRDTLNIFKREGMITVESNQGVSVITLCNYDKYNSPLEEDESVCKSKPQKVASDTASGTPFDTENGTLNTRLISLLHQYLTQQTTHLLTQQTAHHNKERHTSDTKNKKEEEYKESTLSKESVPKKDAAIAATLKRKDAFYSSLIPYVPKYGSEMIRAFFDYWTEKNRSKTKMRFEQQTTWELPLRLATWASREPARRKTTPADNGVVLRDNSTEKYHKDSDQWNR